jgi:hypothetical protein
VSVSVERESVCMCVCVCVCVCACVVTCGVGHLSKMVLVVVVMWRSGGRDPCEKERTAKVSNKIGKQIKKKREEQDMTIRGGALERWQCFEHPILHRMSAAQYIVRECV